MKLRPRHDRIIVKRLEEERKSADNGKLIAMGVKPGDKVLFGKYSGQEFKLEGQDLLHMREDDVIGIVD